MEQLTIMIVEDDAPLRTIMQLILEERPHRVEFAENGTRALATAQEITPSIVVIDVGLPDMTGFELARRLRERGSEAYLVAFTGFDDEQTRQKATESGFNRFFHKPLDLESMESIFTQIISEGGASA